MPPPEKFTPSRPPMVRGPGAPYERFLPVHPLERPQPLVPTAPVSFAAGLLRTPAGSAVWWLYELYQEHGIDVVPGYDPLSDPDNEGFEPRAFIGAMSPAASARRRNRLRTIGRADVAMAAHPIAGFGGMMLDPTMWIAPPLAMARGVGAVRGALRFSAANMAIVAPLEATRLVTDPSASLSEVGLVTLAAGVLGVPVGAAMGHVGPAARRMAAAEGDETVRMGARTGPEPARRPDAEPFDRTGAPGEAARPADEFLDDEPPGMDQSWLTRDEQGNATGIHHGPPTPLDRTGAPELDPSLPHGDERPPVEPFEIEPDRPGLGSPGAEWTPRVDAAGEPLEGFRPVGAFGLEKLSLSPAMRRLSRTASKVTAETLVKLTTPRWLMKHHGEGKPSPVSVATLLAQHHVPLFGAMKEVDRLYLKYRGKVAGQMPRLRAMAAGVEAKMRRDGMSHGEFREAIGAAMHMGDEHAIPEVAEAARMMRARVAQPLNEKAAKAGLWGDGAGPIAQPLNARSYFPSIWRHDKIHAKREQFTAQLAADLSKAGRNPDDAGDIVKSLLGEGEKPDIVAGADVGGKAPAEHVRKLDFIDTADYLEYLELDVDVGMRHLVRGLSADLELTKAFGDRMMEGEIARINGSYGGMIARAETAAEKAALAKELEADLAAVRGLRDAIRGTLGRPEAPDSWSNRTLQALRSYNVLTYMGGAAVANLSDFARPIMTEGIQRTMGSTWAAFNAGLDTLQMAKHEVQLSGTGLDVQIAQRGAQLANAGDTYGKSAKWERVLHNAAETFSLVNLLAPETVVAKTFAALPIMTRIVDDSIAWAKMLAGEVPPGVQAKIDKLDARLLAVGDNLEASIEAARRAGGGEVSPRVRAKLEEFAAGQQEKLREQMDALRARGGVSTEQIEKLARGTIGEDMAKRIAEQAQEWGTRHEGPGGGHVWLPNTEAWTDDGAREVFRSALYNDVDRTITTPNIGDLPIWASSELGRAALQFRSFSLTAYQTVLVAGLQERDAAALMGVMSMIAMGALVDRLKEIQYGMKPATPEERLVNAIDRSGITAWLFDVNNMTERLSGGGVGLRSMLGQDPEGPAHSSIGDRLQMLAPGVSQIGNAATLIEHSLTGNLERWDAVRLRKMLAYNQVFYLQGLFDELEDGLKAAGK